jgi:hypothetical protein
MEEGPSPRAWESILERAVAPEHGIWSFVHRHAAGFAARLRTATAVTAMALAGIIATSTHVAITHPEAGSAETEIAPSAAGELYERQALVPRPRTAFDDHVPVAYVGVSTPSDPEAAFLVSAALATALPAAEATEQAAGESAIESAVSLNHASRQTPADPVADPRRDQTSGPAPEAPDASAGTPF